jgi:FAD/FMN-containing dehydrogenase
MTRRELLSLLIAVPASSTVARGAGLGAILDQRTAASALRSRVRPGQPGWPAPEAWAALKERVGGNLLQPSPLLAACAADAQSSACADVKQHLRNPFYLGDQPSGTQVSGWLDAWMPQPSAYVVPARNAQDVAAAGDFAREHNVRLVVKGGGHSYQGTSNAPDSLLVWTRRMRGITLHDRFAPRGCSAADAAPAVSIESGAMWIDAYDAVTTKAGRYVQGGGCTTVGVAGLIQSGGFGSFSKGFGLAAASLLEAEVVTADGRIRTVNRCQDPDLYWALKGGGGGTFGVVTRVTLRTYDLPEFFGSASAKIQASSDAAFTRLVAMFIDFYAASLMNPHWGESVTFRRDNTFEISMVCQGLTGTETDAAWRPFFDWVKAAPADYSFQDGPSVGVRTARTWWDAETRRKQGSKSMVPDDRPDAPAAHAWWSGDQEQVSAFLYAYDSLWLPESLLNPSRRVQLTSALVAASRHWGVMLHFNKGLAGAPADMLRAARDTATNPKVTTAFALVIIATGGVPRYPELHLPVDDAAAHRDAEAVGRAAAELRRIAPQAGSYVSESNYFNRDWGNEYWGTANYARLRRIKQQYDPSGLFYVHNGIGSELWDENGFKPKGI